MPTNSVYRKINPISDLVIDETCTFGCDDTYGVPFVAYEFRVAWTVVAYGAVMTPQLWIF